MARISRGALVLKELVRPNEERLTQVQIAERLGVTQQAVSTWLRGVGRPDHRRMVQIAEMFGVPVAAWDEEAGEAESASSLEPVDTSADTVPADADASGPHKAAGAADSKAS